MAMAHLLLHAIERTGHSEESVLVHVTADEAQDVLLHAYLCCVEEKNPYQTKTASCHQ